MNKWSSNRNKKEVNLSLLATDTVKGKVRGHILEVQTVSLSVVFFNYIEDIKNKSHIFPFLMFISKHIFNIIEPGHL